MDAPAEPPKLRVAEAIYHVADLEAALSFYTEVLGATVLWNFGQDMAGVSLQGLYQLALIPARWDKDWQPGDRVPPPLLSLECTGNIHAEVDRLANFWLYADLGGNAESMLTATVDMLDGNKLFIWQDASPMEQPALDPQPEPYNFIELLLFFEDLPLAERYFEAVGFTELTRHGEVYTAYTLGSALPVGLMSWRHWFDPPAEGEPPAPPRLALECEDIAAEHARLSAAGANIEPLKGSPNGLEWFTLRDPDGNPLTFWQYQRQPQPRQ